LVIGQSHLDGQQKIIALKNERVSTLRNDRLEPTGRQNGSPES
jgi:hypothetical protein